MMIVKIGGGDNINTRGILEDVTELDEPIILVHGANAVRDRIANGLNKPTKHITSMKGFESVYTDEDAMDILMMAYAGVRNKRIVEMCHQIGINAIGLTGLDGKLVSGERNKGIRVEENGKKKIVRDFSGKSVKVNADLINLLHQNGYTPVICPPILSEENIALNTQNDGIIAAIAASMPVDTIVDLFAERGLLEDKDDPETLISKLTKDEIASYIEKTGGRMRRKIHAMSKVFDSGVRRLIFSDGRADHPLKNALEGKGTVIE